MLKKIGSIFLFTLIFCIISGFPIHASEATEILEPMIDSISIITENIEAPGNVEMEIVLSENRCLNAVNLVFRKDGDFEKVLYYWLEDENISYSEADGKNRCTLNLAENVPAGNYQLVEIELIDSEERCAKYVSYEAGLKNWNNECEIAPVELEVISGCQDTDFQVPELLSISVDAEVEAGSNIKANIKVQDDSGIKSAEIVYYDANTGTYLFLNPIDKSWNSQTETYIFTYKIPKYQDAGTYTFDSLCLIDNSAYENNITYWRKDSLLTNLDNQTVSASECRRLKIYFENSENVALILYENLYRVVRDAEANSTVIYRGGDSKGSPWVLDHDSLKMAKEKMITLVLPDMFTDSEIIINTPSIPGSLPTAIYAGFIFEQLQDNNYDIKLQMSQETLPFVLKFKMDGLELSDEQVYQLYKINNDGTLTAMGNPLNINEEGYLNIEFPNGLQGTDEWNSFRLIKTERRNCAGTHQWGEYVLKEKASMDKEGKKQSVCQNCGEIRTQAIPKISQIILSAAKYIYDDSAKTPIVTIKDVNNAVLTKGTDYSVTYPKTRKNVGRYYVTITFKGKYDGTVKKYFTIVPKRVTNLSIVRYQYGNQVRLSWTKSKGATGYRIYMKKGKTSKYEYLKSTVNSYFVRGNLTKNMTYYFKIIPYYENNGVDYYSMNAYLTVLQYTSKKGGKLVKVNNVGVVKKGTNVKISWKNVNYETGYQISRAATKTGTNIVSTFKTTNGTSKTVAATKGKTYYYKVRAYRIVDNRKIFGAWSAPVKYTRK